MRLPRLTFGQGDTHGEFFDVHVSGPSLNRLGLTLATAAGSWVGGTLAQAPRECDRHGFLTSVRAEALSAVGLLIFATGDLLSLSRQLLS